MLAHLHERLSLIQNLPFIYIWDMRGGWLGASNKLIRQSPYLSLTDFKYFKQTKPLILTILEHIQILQIYSEMVVGPNGYWVVDPNLNKDTHHSGAHMEHVRRAHCT